MDNWARMQDLVENMFGRRPDSPEMLLEYMILMADMIIENNHQTSGKSDKSSHLSFQH